MIVEAISETNRGLAWTGDAEQNFLHFRAVQGCLWKRPLETELAANGISRSAILNGAGSLRPTFLGLEVKGPRFVGVIYIQLVQTRDELVTQVEAGEIRQLCRVHRLQVKRQLAHDFVDNSITAQQLDP